MTRMLKAYQFSSVYFISNYSCNIQTVPCIGETEDGISHRDLVIKNNMIWSFFESILFSLKCDLNCLQYELVNNI